MVAGMGIFSSPPSAPYVPPLPPEPALPPPPPTPVDKSVTDAANDTQARARASAGYGSTIATSGQGVSAPAVTAFKTLLGQ